MAGSQVHSTTKVFGRGFMVEAFSADKGRGAEVIRRNAEISKVGWGTFIMPFNLSAKGRKPQYIMFKAVDTYCMQSWPLPLFCGLVSLTWSLASRICCFVVKVISLTNKTLMKERKTKKRRKKNFMHGLFMAFSVNEALWIGFSLGCTNLRKKYNTILKWLKVERKPCLTKSQGTKGLDVLKDPGWGGVVMGNHQRRPVS